MRHWERCSRKGDFFYALLVFAAFVVLRFAFLADLVEYAGSFSHAEEAAHASDEDAGSKESAVVVAAAGEKK